LPEAHVEAPTPASMILAALLLKVGGYGITKFLLLIPAVTAYIRPFIAWLCCITILIAAVAAAVQIDIKRIVAYSSIVHINIGILGVFTLTQEGGVGGLIIIISHGIVSAGLFYLIGVLYNRYSTRLFNYYGALIITIPIFSIFFFIFILSNISFPLTSGFFGELFVVIGLVKKHI
jgi:NADH-quinone oxidoreductase subunit M